MRTMSNYLTVWTIDQIVANFRRGVYADSKWADPTAVTYGFATSQSAYPNNYGPERNSFSPFTAQQQQAAILAISLWTDVANITITPAADPNKSNLRFSDTTTGPSVSEAFMPGISGTFSGDLWFNPSYIYNQSPGTLGGYGFLAMIHEIGHSIGMPHPGDYNGGSPTYEVDALYQQDTRQYSVMSYFPAFKTGAAHGGFYASTPLVDDIAAIQYVYGANMSTRAGDTVYGFHTNISDRPMFDFTVNTSPIVAIWDGGGNDTIDLSGSSSAAYLDLNEGAFSNVMGLTKNLAIAYGTVIENAIGTSASDVIIGNAADNVLSGGPGNDTLMGGAGNDTLIGGAGDDTLIGGPGIDDAVFTGLMSAYMITRVGSEIDVSGPDGTDVLRTIEEATFSDITLIFGQGPTHTDFNRDLNSDVLWQNANGQAAIWTMNGFSQLGGSPVGGNPGSTWHVKGAGDFNGDGYADILWQNDNGQAAIWTMNGFTQLGGSPVGVNPGSSWHVIGAGDFNGDGKADILWQNDSGQAAIWLMNGFTLLGASPVGGNPGSSWHVIGSGDFNGDGKSDILWQNDSGQAAIWTMDGFTVLAASPIGGNPGSTWHVKAAGDFNGDGKSDILWQNDNGQAAIWTMDGFTQLAGNPVGGNPGSSWHVKGAGDFNGDGYADILWQNDNGQAAIWTMNGFTQIGGSSVGGNPGSTWHVLAMGS
jgi:hypothetical protein